MSVIITSEYELQKVTPPALPFATPAYNEQYQNQLNNILRLYFNRLQNIIDQLDSGAIQPPLTNYTVATLPFASVAGKGARSFVTDALAPVFGATVVTGGAVAVPVYSDGTNWKVG
jgi:hypothetical protein